VVERFSHGVSRWTRYNTCKENDGDDVARLLVRAFPEIECWIAPSPRPDHCFRHPDAAPAQ
jgi:hypothetical protein